MFVLRCNVGWFSNARVDQILLADVWVSMRMLLWWCNYHRTIMVHIVTASKVLVLGLVSTTCCWTQGIFQSVEEFRILLRVASRSCIGATALYIWTVWVGVLLPTSKAVFSVVLKARHAADLVKIGISRPKLVDDEATYDWLNMRILEYIQMLVVFHLWVALMGFLQQRFCIHLFLFICCIRTIL